jgi:hypothetical protein
MKAQIVPVFDLLAFEWLPKYLRAKYALRIGVQVRWVKPVKRG